MVRLTEVIRRKHLALNTEQSYCAWLKRYCDHAKQLPAQMPSGQKVERFLTALAKTGIASSTQNQALNAVVLFYKEVLGQPPTMGYLHADAMSVASPLEAS